MIGSPSRRRAFMATGAVAFGLAAARRALAHSEVRHAEPTKGAVLRSSPPAISLMFSAPVRVMSLRLIDERGCERRLNREGERTASVAGRLPDRAVRRLGHGAAGVLPCGQPWKRRWAAGVAGSASSAQRAPWRPMSGFRAATR